MVFHVIHVLGSTDTVSKQKSLAKSVLYAMRHTFDLNLSTSLTLFISALVWIMLFSFLLKLIICSVHTETVGFVLQTQVNLNKTPFLLIPTRDNVKTASDTL